MSTSRLRLLADDIGLDDTPVQNMGYSAAAATESATRSERSIRTNQGGVVDNADLPKKIPTSAGHVESMSSIADNLDSSLGSSKPESTPVELSFTPITSSGASTTSSAYPNKFLKLQRQRLHNERIRASLEEAMQTFEALQKQENQMRQKISKAHEVIQNLRDQSDSLESTYSGMEKLYRTNCEKLKLLQQSLKNVKEEWYKESAQFKMYSGQLRKLQERLPELTHELGRFADESNHATNNLIQKLSKPKIENGNSTPRMGSNSAEVAIQTNCDMSTINELEYIRKQVFNQRAQMKQVRETVELLRKCP